MAFRSLLRLVQEPSLSRDNPTRNRTCSEFEVDNWALSDLVVRKLVPIVGIHPFPLHELMLMAAAVCRLEPTEIFEWGTHIGKSARVFHECASHYRLKTEIHSTDLPDSVHHQEHPHADRGRLVRGRPHVHLHQGDGLDVSLELWRVGGRKPRPLFFLDGDHAYLTVVRELTGIADEVPDAAVLVHDAFYQSAGSGYNIGPHEAIEEVTAIWKDRYRRLDSGLGLPGLTLLYPASDSD
jgi:cephalosporin hydroxylase